MRPAWSLLCAKTPADPESTTRTLCRSSGQPATLNAPHSLLAARHTYTFTPAGEEAWAASSPRPPSARQAPKLNKGSPLPHQRVADLINHTTSLLRPTAFAVPAQHIDTSSSSSLHGPLARSESHSLAIHRPVWLDRPRTFSTKKLKNSNLALPVRLRVTQHLHDHTSGSSRSCLTPSRLRRVPIARSPTVSPISHIVDLEPLAVPEHLLDRPRRLWDTPAYTRVTSDRIRTLAFSYSGRHCRCLAASIPAARCQA